MSSPVLILTKKNKLQKALILLSIIFVCLSLQFFVNNINFEKLENVKANESAAVKLEGVAMENIVTYNSSRSSIVHQFVKVNNELITLEVSERLPEGTVLPIWVHEINNGQRKYASSPELTMVENTAYSKESFVVRDEVKNAPLYLLSAIFVFLITLPIIVVNVRKLALLLTNKEVSDFNILFKQSKDLSHYEKRVNVKEKLYIPIIINSFVGVGAFILLYLALDGYDTGSDRNSFVFASLFGLFLTIAAQFMFLYVFNENTKVSFVKLCWFGNVYDASAVSVPWNQSNVKTKIYKWFTKDGIDVEVIDALASSFAGSLKDMKQVAKTLGPEK